MDLSLSFVLILRIFSQYPSVELIVRISPNFSEMVYHSHLLSVGLVMNSSLQDESILMRLIVKLWNQKFKKISILQVRFSTLMDLPVDLACRSVGRVDMWQVEIYQIKYKIPIIGDFIISRIDSYFHRFLLRAFLPFLYQ